MLPSSHSSRSSLWRCCRTLTLTGWLLSFLIHKNNCISMFHIHCLCQSSRISCFRDYLPAYNLHSIGNFPYSVFYHPVPLSDHLSRKNLRACWIITLPAKQQIILTRRWRRNSSELFSYISNCVAYIQHMTSRSHLNTPPESAGLTRKQTHNI